MAEKELEPVIQQVMTEQNQSHETRKRLFVELEKETGCVIFHQFQISSYD